MGGGVRRACRGREQLRRMRSVVMCLLASVGSAHRPDDDVLPGHAPSLVAFEVTPRAHPQDSKLEKRARAHAAGGAHRYEDQRTIDTVGIDLIKLADLVESIELSAPIERGWKQDNGGKIYGVLTKIAAYLFVHESEKTEKRCALLFWMNEKKEQHDEVDYMKHADLGPSTASIRSRYWSIMQKFLKEKSLGWLDEHRKKTCPGGLYLAGFGEGGALASLLAVEMSFKELWGDRDELYTFGAPPIFLHHTDKSIDEYAHKTSFKGRRYYLDEDKVTVEEAVDKGVYKHVMSAEAVKIACGIGCNAFHSAAAYVTALDCKDCSKFHISTHKAS